MLLQLFTYKFNEVYRTKMWVVLWLLSIPLYCLGFNYEHPFLRVCKEWFIILNNNLYHLAYFMIPDNFVVMWVKNADGRHFVPSTTEQRQLPEFHSGWSSASVTVASTGLYGWTIRCRCLHKSHNPETNNPTTRTTKIDTTTTTTTWLFFHHVLCNFRISKYQEVILLVILLSDPQLLILISKYIKRQMGLWSCTITWWHLINHHYSLWVCGI